jgi:putative molybdopterin biosynthesis protein
LTEARSHSAVAAAGAQSRADWGLAIQNVAESSGLAFLPFQDEQYDFAVPRARLARPAVQEFRRLLHSRTTRAGLQQLGFRLSPPLNNPFRPQIGQRLTLDLGLGQIPFR